MGKNKDKIRVSFIGNNATSVAGSMTLIECGKSKKKILIEAGLIQEPVSLLKEYQLNSQKFPFKAKDIDYVFAFHEHIDHIGRIPLLVAKGFTGKIIIPKGTFDVCKELLLDSANIMARDAMDLTKKMGKQFDPIYTPADVYSALDKMEEYEFGVKHKLDEDIEFQLYPSGHVLNSAQGCLWIRNGNTVKKIGVTSDLGNTVFKQYYTNTFEPIPSANLLIGECTYCNRDKSIKKKDRDKDLEKIRSVVYDVCIDGDGKILFPVFAFARTQTILTVLYELFKDDDKFNVPIYVGSPLASKVSKAYSENLFNEEQLEQWKKVLSWNKIHFIKEFTELEGLLKNDTPMILCCGSGMMNAGYSVYVAEKLLPKSKNCIMFCGFSVEGSLAYKIKQKKQKSISINGKQISNRCNIVNLSSFSSHMQREELKALYSGGMVNGVNKNGGNYDMVALVHGEQNDKIEFAKEIQEEVSKHNKTTRIISVNKNTSITL